MRKLLDFCVKKDIKQAILIFKSHFVYSLKGQGDDDNFVILVKTKLKAKIQTIFALGLEFLVFNNIESHQQRVF